MNLFKVLRFPSIITYNTRVKLATFKVIYLNLLVKKVKIGASEYICV